MFTVWRYSRIWALKVKNLIEQIYIHGKKEDITDVYKEIINARDALCNLDTMKNKCGFVDKMFCIMSINNAQHTLALLEDLKTFLEGLDG